MYKRQVYDDLNNKIENDLASNIDYKVGTEIKLNKLSIRAGFKSINNPYKNDNKNFINSQSIGLGYNFEASTIDLAIQSSKLEYNYQLFDTGLTDQSLIINKQLKLIFSYNIIF